jgi:predicted negative regulator of RcsB-dependent stress response
VEIQRHPERTKILDGMKDADYTAYDAWQSGKVQVAINDGNEAANRKQVAITKNETNVRGILANVERMLSL